MRTVQDQLTHILATVKPVSPLRVALLDAMGAILAQDVTAPHDLPRCAVAALDGYAVNSADLAHLGLAGEVSVAQTGILPRITLGAPPPPPPPGSTATGDVMSEVTLPVTHDLTAQHAHPSRLAPGQAVRVTSGAVLPSGADAVVPLLWTDRGTSRVTIHRAVRPGAGVRNSGADVPGGQSVLKAGVRLGPRQISLAAALGLPGLVVHPKPRVVIISVGDELAEPGGRIDGVYDANSYALTAAVQDTGASAIRVGAVSDDRNRLSEFIEDQLVRADVIITSGGLSEGWTDTVRDVLSALGEVRFDHIAMAPGRQQGFGMLNHSDREVPVIALPGHPAAAFISFEVFARPLLRAMAGYHEVFRPSVQARVTEAWESSAGVRQFIPAQVLGNPDSGYTVSTQGRGPDLSLQALAAANVLAVVPEGVSLVRPGDLVHCLVLEAV